MTLWIAIRASTVSAAAVLGSAAAVGFGLHPHQGAATPLDPPAGTASTTQAGISDEPDTPQGPDPAQDLDADTDPTTTGSFAAPPRAPALHPHLPIATRPPSATPKSVTRPPPRTPTRITEPKTDTSKKPQKKDSSKESGSTGSDSKQKRK